MKRRIYITLFILLGLLIQQFVHGSLEIAYGILLFRDWTTWSLGLSYESWVWIHHFMALLLFILGTWYGYRGGVYWWDVLYDTEGKMKPAPWRKGKS